MIARATLESKPDVWAEIARLRISTLDVLAPRVQDGARAALRECEGQIVTVVLAGRSDVITLPLDVVVHETARTNALQMIYYQQGTTHAATAELSWHFFRLAIDNISRKYGWFSGAAAREAWPDTQVRAIVAHAWFRAMGQTFKRHGFDWGGDWHHPDEPHVQWGTLKYTPSARARELYALGGFERVWREVGAMAA